MLEALHRHFGDRASVRGDAAGLHMTVRFTGTPGLGALAERQRVHLSSSNLYYLGTPAPNEYILGFSAISERAIREAVKRIAEPGGRSTRMES